MALYDTYDVYGPYTRKDGRQQVILYDGIERKTLSYPKYIMECHLGRKLNDDETIHHKDGNFLNNDINNLEILPRVIHSSLHRKGEHFVEVTCSNCKVIFTLSLQVFNAREKKSKSGNLFCSAKCNINRF